MGDSLLLLAWIVAKIIIVLIALIVGVIVVMYAERKVIAYLHSRIGPNRVGFIGTLQPIADAIKLLTKELVIPNASNRYLFILAPTLTIIPALAAWAVIPFNEGMMLANINLGILFILTMSSMSVYGVMIAGWASNSKYAMFGSLRAAAQTISYEISMGFALIGVMMAAGSLNLQEVVLKQQGGLWHWYFIPLLPLFFVYWISGIAETNRLPFDVVEGESELVGGFHVEYSGMMFALFFLSEYMNMILISVLISILFLGGWLSPFEGIPYLNEATAWVPGIIWLMLKACVFLYIYIWIRGTFPRYRYDQIMRLGWKILLPVTILWIVVIGLAVQFKIAPWFLT